MPVCISIFGTWSQLSAFPSERAADFEDLHEGLGHGHYPKGGNTVKVSFVRDQKRIIFGKETKHGNINDGN